MDFEIWFKIIFFFVSASVGVLFGILRSRIFIQKNSDNLHNYFTAFSILLTIGGPVILFFYRDELINDPGGLKYFELFILTMALLLGLILLYQSKKYLFFKDVFKTSELDPIVNNFTSNADRNTIKLFGGDLNFFGNTPAEMETNSQYTHLRSLQFKKVLILCESPKNSIQKTRYGKILSDMSCSELRFYQPELADLRVRGRIIKLNGVSKLLIYTKIKSGIYQAIETDTANSAGARYINIWDLVWSLATQPSQAEIDKYKSLL